MNPESQDFEQLRRLFAIKRHEEPPPGYFNCFSRDVIARIKAGDQGKRSLRETWPQRLWAMLEAKPIFAGAFGVSVCAVLISGILNSEEGAISGSAVNPVISQANSPFTPATIALNQGMPSDPVLSTNSTASLDSLFDFHLTTQPQRASATENLLDGK
jgi:hypothetical protein